MKTALVLKDDSLLLMTIKVILIGTVFLLTLDAIHVRFYTLKDMADEISSLRYSVEKQSIDISNLVIKMRHRRETSLHTDVQYLRRTRRHVDNRDTLLTFLKYLSIGKNLPSTCIANHTVICVPGRKGEKGNPGKAGPIGLIGSKGLKGDIGLSGPQGLVGLKGETGKIGSMGPKGEKGAAGKSIYIPVITSPPKSVRVLEGRNTTFFCEANGNPLPTIKWQIEKDNDSRYHFNGEKGLTIDDVRDGDSGRVICIASNLLGIERKHAVLTVLVKPRVTVLPKQVTVFSNSKLNISCNVKGNPSPTVTWKKAYGVLRIKGTSTSTGQVISFQNVRQQDAGLYICTAKNSLGSALDTSILAVASAPKTCKDALKQGRIQSGIYTIKPDSRPSFEVFCDMKTDGGGWIVLQRRIDNTTNFYRNWTEYKAGFGNLASNFWLGLEHIHRLANAKRGAVLRVELRHKNGMTGFAKYNTFRVNDESNKYKLEVGGFSGNAEDSLGYHNGMYFSTYDVDNDKSGSNCAMTSRGGWWYKGCYNSNLNGDFPPPYGSTNGKFISWYKWFGQIGNIFFSEMKIK